MLPYIILNGKVLIECHAAPIGWTPLLWVLETLCLLCDGTEDVVHVLEDLDEVPQEWSCYVQVLPAHYDEAKNHFSSEEALEVPLVVGRKMT